MAIDLTPEMLEEYAQGSAPVVIKFFADWCGPCKMFAPIFEKAAAKVEDKAVFAQVDIDAQPALAEKFEIMNVPAIVLIKNGETVKKHSGIMNENQLLKLVEEA